MTKTLYQWAFLAATPVAVLVASMPLRASEADDRIEASFKKTYVYNTYLRDDRFAPETKDGVFTLTRTVAETSLNRQAHETSANPPEITRVDIAPQCRHHVAAGRTLVEVNDGVVTLKGEASSMTQKDLSTEYARNIEGVREVRNEMTVAAPEETEPTEGQKADEIPGSPPVKTALLNHRPTSSVKTKVERRNAKVSLTGMARNESANSPVTTPVTDMQDVTSLGHQMTGQPVSTK